MKQSSKPRPNWDLAAIMLIGGLAIGAQPLVLCIKQGQTTLGLIVYAAFVVASCVMAWRAWKP